MIDNELQKVTDVIRELLSEPVLNDELEKFVNTGSKMLRSKLAILYLKANGEDISDEIYKVLAAGEILHNASLLHDDIIDDADERRGVQTIGAKYDSKISILGGDYLVSKAVELLSEVNNSNVLRYFNTCLQDMCKAEISQYLKRGELPSKEEYLKICEGKTASLFVAIFKSCTEFTSVSAKDAENFANNFGIYFQIKNDSESLSAVQDKRNKIFTAVDIMGIENARYLLDNYMKELMSLISAIPGNNWRDELESLIKGL